MNFKNINVTLQRIAQIEADHNNHLFIAETEQRLAATVFVTLCLDPMYDSQPHVVLENLIVDCCKRGSGIGRLLLHYVERFCRRRGCSKIMLQSNKARSDAHRFLPN